MVDIHKYGKRLERARYKLKADTHAGDGLTPHNRDLVLEFADSLLAEGISNTRVWRYVAGFRTLAPHIDFPLDEPEEKKLKEIVAAVNTDEIRKQNGEPYSVHSKAELRGTLRRFYVWETGEENPDVVDFITTHIKKSEKPKTDPSELPGPAEVRKLLKAAKKKRTEALLFTLWDTAGRIGEVLNLKWKDITFGDDLSQVRFRESKTGERRVPIREAVPTLQEWRNEHGRGDDPDAFVFGIMQQNQGHAPYSKPISYNMASRSLKRAAREAGIDCKVNPHAFRKGRATWLATQGMGAPTLMEYCGWTTMETAETYVRLAQKDLENAVRDIQGMETHTGDGNGDDVESLRPVRCGSCGTVNPAHLDFCRADDCTAVVTRSTQVEQQLKKQDVMRGVRDELIREAADELGWGEEKIDRKIDAAIQERL